MVCKIKLVVRVLVVLSFVFLNINALMAVAFPFREFAGLKDHRLRQCDDNALLKSGNLFFRNKF